MYTSSLVCRFECSMATRLVTMHNVTVLAYDANTRLVSDLVRVRFDVASKRCQRSNVTADPRRHIELERSVNVSWSVMLAEEESLGFVYDMISQDVDVSADLERLDMVRGDARVKFDSSSGELKLAKPLDNGANWLALKFRVVIFCNILLISVLT